MKYEFRNRNGNSKVRARTLNETLEEIVSAINSIGLRLPLVDEELSISVLQIAEVIDDYRAENLSDNSLPDESIMKDGIVTINYDQRQLPPPSNFAIIGAIYGHNACCKDKPFLLCANRSPNDGSLNYSCECYCGLFCTNGHNNLLDAIEEYESLIDHRMEGEEYGRS